MSEKPQAPREFQLVDDAKEAKKLLKEGAKTLASTMVWSSNQKIAVSTHMTLYSEEDQILYTWIPKDLDPIKFMDLLAQVGTDECFFSVSLSRANIFFKTRYKGHDSGGLKFKEPIQIYKVQRRSDLRFAIPDGHIIKVSFQDPFFSETTLTKKAIDISAGGVALLLEENEKSLFNVGLVLNQMSFNIGGKKITCDGEIRHIKTQTTPPNKSGIRMGILFKNLKQADSQHIASYVFEESRKFYSRFI